MGADAPGLSPGRPRPELPLTASKPRTLKRSPAGPRPGPSSPATPSGAVPGCCPSSRGISGPCCARIAIARTLSGAVRCTTASMTAHRPPPGRLHLPIPPSATPSARPDGAGFAPVHRPPTPARPLPSAPQPGATPGPGAALIAFPFPSPARPRATPDRMPPVAPCHHPRRAPPAHLSGCWARPVADLSGTADSARHGTWSARGPRAASSPSPASFPVPSSSPSRPVVRQCSPPHSSGLMPLSPIFLLRCPWREGLRPPTPGAPSTPPGGDFAHCPPSRTVWITAPPPA